VRGGFTALVSVREFVEGDEGDEGVSRVKVEVKATPCRVRLRMLWRRVRLGEGVCVKCEMCV
jgi:hypothetical protein